MNLKMKGEYMPSEQWAVRNSRFPRGALSEDAFRAAGVSSVSIYDASG
jgi:hypothetical protein